MNVENQLVAVVLPELPEAMRRRYKVVAQLGHGAFGVTLLVTDNVSNERYVAKIDTDDTSTSRPRSTASCSATT